MGGEICTPPSGEMEGGGAEQTEKTRGMGCLFQIQNPFPQGFDPILSPAFNLKVKEAVYKGRI